LLYARPQSLQICELELNAYLAELADSLRTMPCAQERQLTFKLSEEPAWVLADRDKLKQVLVNLVSNACEAVASQEPVICQIDFTSQLHQVCLTIQNGGPPIPPDVLPRLTKPFFTTKSTGNGLGLAIVRRIVEAHGGEFTIDSTATMGTTVSVRLPRLMKSNRRD